jgi:hypothetical protein
MWLSIAPTNGVVDLRSFVCFVFLFFVFCFDCVVSETKECARILCRHFGLHSPSLPATRIDLSDNLRARGWLCTLMTSLTVQPSEKPIRLNVNDHDDE